MVEFDILMTSMEICIFNYGFAFPGYQAPIEYRIDGSGTK